LTNRTRPRFVTFLLLLQATVVAVTAEVVAAEEVAEVVAAVVTVEAVVVEGKVNRLTTARQAV
jgi:hypothetical protein